MIKAFLIFAALAATTASASAEEYYVVRGPDKECRIVSSRPTDSTIVQLGPLAFQTRDDAERQRTVLCKDSHDERVIIKRD